MYQLRFTPTRGLDMITLEIDKIRREYPEVLMFFLGLRFHAGKDEGHGAGRQTWMTMLFIPMPVLAHQIPRYLHSAHIGILAFPNHEWWSVQSPLKLFEYLTMSKPADHIGYSNESQCGRQP